MILARLAEYRRSSGFADESGRPEMDPPLGLVSVGDLARRAGAPSVVGATGLSA
jgi:hypothetical protein